MNFCLCLIIGSLHNVNTTLSTPLSPRYLVLQGHPEPQRGRTVTVRPVTQAKVGGDALRFVRSLSYTFAFEFARQGFVFVYQDNVRISVTRLYKVE